MFCNIFSCIQLKLKDPISQVDNTAERGARMKSVGVISSNYLALFQHEEKLVELAQESVERPGAYEQLIQYFAEYNQSFSVPVSLEMKSNTVGSMYDLFKSQGLFISYQVPILMEKEHDPTSTSYISEFTSSSYSIIIYLMQCKCMTFVIGK